MQKVVGSNPISRFPVKPARGAGFKLSFHESPDVGAHLLRLHQQSMTGPFRLDWAPLVSLTCLLALIATRYSER